MGILPGVTVRIIKKAPFNGPVELKVRGYEVALRYRDANQVFVK
jgi:Fe2+ transport system protein FeoA